MLPYNGLLHFYPPFIDGRKGLPMCGIAGFCLSDHDLTFVNTRRLAANLLRGIEHRGKDATGAAWRDPDTGTFHQPVVQKRDVPASIFVRELSMPRKARVGILHTRFATQGHEKYMVNNHPISTGGIVGVHNGHVDNDADLFEDMGIQDRRIGQVDSEAIFAALAWGNEPDDKGRALLPGSTSPGGILSNVEGGAAVGWLDAMDDPNVLHCARIFSSPFVWAQTVGGSFLFASTTEAIKEACQYAGLVIETIDFLKEGSYLRVQSGVITDVENFEPAGYGYKRWTGKYGGSHSGSSYTYTCSSTKAKAEAEAGISTNNDPSEYEAWWDANLREVELLDSTGITEDRGGEVVTKGPTRAAAVTTLIPDTYIRGVKNSVPNANFADHLKHYPDREAAIESWLLGYRGDGQTAYETARILGAELLEGDWVLTDFGGHSCYGQIVRLPHTFPSGEYLLRVVMGGDVGYVYKASEDFRLATSELAIGVVEPASEDANA